MCTKFKPRHSSMSSLAVWYQTVRCSRLTQTFLLTSRLIIGFADVDRHKYRGNTLRLSRDGKYLFASTRGSSSSVKGYVAAFALSSDGKLSDTKAVAHYETATSCGIAGAIEPAFWKGSDGIAGQDYLIHVDEEAGFVNILGWSGALKKFSEIASTQLPKGASASHAVWLS